MLTSQHLSPDIPLKFNLRIGDNLKPTTSHNAIVNSSSKWRWLKVDAKSHLCKSWFFSNKRNDINHLLTIIFEVKPWILLLESTELCQLCVMTVYPEHEIEVDFQIKNKTLKVRQSPSDQSTSTIFFKYSINNIPK